MTIRVSCPSFGLKNLYPGDLDPFYVDRKFEDGTAPTKEIVARWLELNDEVFFEHNPNQDRCIAVHCVSGIGRAPVMVAVSLIEGGMDPLVSFLVSRFISHRSSSFFSHERGRNDSTTVSVKKQSTDPNPWETLQDSIAYIRKARRGALNRVQIAFLDG